MIELLTLLGDYWLLAPIVLLLLGFVPNFLLRQVVRLYPPDDPRRSELIAEMCVLGRFRKWEWLGETMSTAVCEGLPLRLRARRLKRKRINRTRFFYSTKSLQLRLDLAHERGRFEERFDKQYGFVYRVVYSDDGFVGFYRQRHGEWRLETYRWDH